MRHHTAGSDRTREHAEALETVTHLGLSATDLAAIVAAECGPHETTDTPLLVAALVAAIGLERALIELHTWAAVRRATQLGLDAEELDDAVHDVFGRAASSAWNSGDGDDSDDGNEAVHDEYSLAASEVNNGGVSCQVRFLIGAIGFDATMALLESSREATPTK